MRGEEDMSCRMFESKSEAVCDRGSQNLEHGGGGKGKSLGDVYV